MEVLLDHLTIPNTCPYSKGPNIEVLNKATTMLYLSEFYVEYSPSKPLHVSLRANIDHQISLGPYITIQPFDQKRIELIQKHFTQLDDETQKYMITLPKQVTQELSLLTFNYSFKEGKPGIDLTTYPLYANIVCVTGGSGVGKTTLCNKVKEANPNIDCFDMDDLNEQHGWKQDKNRAFIEKYVESGHPVVFFGTTFWGEADLRWLAQKGFVIDLDKKEHYKRLMSRIFNSLLEHQDLVKEAIEKGTLDKEAHNVGLTRPFEPYHDRWTPGNPRSPLRYKALPSDAIFDILTSWSVTWFDTPMHLEKDKKQDVLESFKSLVGKPFPKEYVIKNLDIASFDKLSNHKCPPSTSPKQPLSSIYPKWKDRRSVLHNLWHKAYPITIYKDKLIDGVHRLIACYLMGSIPKVCELL